MQTGNPLSTPAYMHRDRAGSIAVGDYPFFVHWNSQTRLFDVYLDGHLVGSHKGRLGADRIGWDAFKAHGGEPAAVPRRVGRPPAAE